MGEEAGVRYLEPPSKGRKVVAHLRSFGIAGGKVEVPGVARNLHTASLCPPSSEVVQEEADILMVCVN